MPPNVVVIGTLDTKGPETAYLRDRLAELGCATTVVDSGILGEPEGIVPDIDHAEVARRGGTSIDALRDAGSRGRAVERMRELLRELVADLHGQGRVDGIIAMGGAEGAVMGAAAMMVLPVGIPKVLVSPIASGRHYFGPLVGTRDVMVVHSVVDILGLNHIATAVFDNAAAALAGMAHEAGRRPRPGPDDRAVAITMLGNTTTAVMAARRRLEESAYMAVIFHSNGVGGPAMEELVVEDQFVGVIDFTTNELVDPLVGGIHDGGSQRLRTTAAHGLPQVVVPGCVDFSVFHTGTVPPELADRPVYDHNPEYTLVRSSAEEMLRVAEIFGERLNPATGPVQVAVPTQGLSIPNVPDGPFWDPETDRRFREALRAELRGDIPVHHYDHHVNDEAFGEQVADLFVATHEQETT